MFEKLDRDILEKAEEMHADEIARKQKHIAEHEKELKTDKDKLLRDLREKEIEHDENVIAREEKRIGKDERKIKEDNAEIEAKAAK